jgi:hypothetical protein
VRKNVSFVISAVVVVFVVLTVASRPTFGQRRWPVDTPKLPMAETWLAHKATLPPYTPPRTPWGVPDLQGEWGGAGGGGGDDMEEHEYVDVTTPPQESYISDPADGKIPYTPWALAKRNEMRAGLARGWPGESGERLYGDPASYCITMIGPRGEVGEIIQRPDEVIMVSERLHRIIPTDGRPPIGDRAKFWRGNSRGRWEGDTLVVDVTSLNGLHWFDSVANFYSENARMTERFTLVDANMMDYSITIEDPTVYTRPWTMSYPRRRAGTGGVNRETGEYEWSDTVAVDPDPYASERWEDSCNEGVGHTISGLRDTGFKWFRGVTPPR